MDDSHEPYIIVESLYEEDRRTRVRERRQDGNRGQRREKMPHTAAVEYGGRGHKSRNVDHLQR